MNVTPLSAPERPTDVRVALLDAAEIEIGENGADRVSLRAVARRACVSHQAPAHFFVNKRGMFTALATRTFERLLQTLLDTVERHRDDAALVRLSQLGMAYVEFSVSSPGLFTLTSSPDQIEVGDPALDKARTAAWAVLADVVAEAQRDGWRSDESTETLALACWALVHGSAGLWRDGWLGAWHGEKLRSAVWSMLTAMVGDVSSVATNL